MYRQYTKIFKNPIARNLITLAIVLVVGSVILSLLQKIINKYFEESERKNPLNSAKIETVSKAISSIVRFIIGFIIIIIILDMVGINTRSLIATAGIGGIAIAFGAQSIIQDFIKGMFMIIDDTIRVGDFVECASITGTVESVGLRLTKIRNYDGSLHTIPNSQIQSIKNYSRGPQRAEVLFSVSYDVNYQQIKKICEEVSEKLEKTEGFENIFVEKLKLLGIEDMTDLSYKVKVTSLVLENRQYETRRKIRELLKEEFEKNGLQASIWRKNEKIQNK